MIILGTDKNTISVAIDLVQAKHLVETLRQATEDQMKDAAGAVFAAGFDNNSVLDTLAAVHSFVNIVGFFSDKLGVRPKAEAEPVETQDAPVTVN